MSKRAGYSHSQHKPTFNLFWFLSFVADYDQVHQLKPVADNNTLLRPEEKWNQWIESDEKNIRRILIFNFVKVCVFSRNFVLFRTKIQWAASAQKPPLRSFSYYYKCQRGGMVNGEQISFWKRPFVFPLLPESSSVLYEARMWPSPKCKKITRS